MDDWIFNFDKWAAQNGKPGIAKPVQYGQAMSMPCTVKGFLGDSYGKYPKSMVSN